MVTTETRAGTAGALITATAELVEERGPSGVSLREVARRVGVSHGAPLRHFSGIADLLTAVAVDGFRALQADVAASMARSGTDSVARLAGAGRGYVQCATAHPGTFALMFRPDLLVTADADFATVGLAAFGQLVDAVRAAQADGWKPDEPSLVLAGALWASVHGLAQLWSQDAMVVPTANLDLSLQLDVLFRALGLPTEGEPS